MRLTRRQEIFDRLVKNTEFSTEHDGCWTWKGGTSGEGRGGGYGRISIDGCTSATHIVAFVHYFGYKPPKKQVDHTCNNRLCWRPDHLELVTGKENHKRRVERSLADTN